MLRPYLDTSLAVSVVGFAVPIKEIAGRVDLLVTQLLTSRHSLANIFSLSRRRHSLLILL